MMTGMIRIVVCSRIWLIKLWAILNSPIWRWATAEIIHLKLWFKRRSPPRGQKLPVKLTGSQELIVIKTTLDSEVWAKWVSQVSLLNTKKWMSTWTISLNFSTRSKLELLFPRRSRLERLRIRGLLKSTIMETKCQQMTHLRMSMGASHSMVSWKSRDLSTMLFIQDGLCFVDSTSIGIDLPMTSNRKVT